MRRSEREMAKNDAERLLEYEQMGVLSIVGSNGEPYGVPLNYCYIREQNAIFFHCAREGRKLDYLSSNPLASFTVVGKQRVVPDKLTTYYESVIVFGRASVVTDSEKELRFAQLCQHLAPDVQWRRNGSCGHLEAAVIIQLDIESISGKKNGDA